jgi:predicted nucleotidyltransferase
VFVLAPDVTQKALVAVRTLGRFGVVRAAYVFGSHAEGSADQWSDIDVAAFMEGVESWDLRRHARAMSHAQKEAGIDVEAHLFPASALDDPEPASFAAYVQRHGVRVFSA